MRPAYAGQPRARAPLPDFTLTAGGRARAQEGVKLPIHIMFQPDHLSAREMALEDVDVYVEEPSFLRALCAETGAVPRAAPMNVRAPAPRPGGALCGGWSCRDARFTPVLTDVAGMPDPMQPCAVRGRPCWHGGRRLAAPHSVHACSGKCIAALSPWLHCKAQRPGYALHSPAHVLAQGMHLSLQGARRTRRMARRMRACA